MEECLSQVMKTGSLIRELDSEKDRNFLFERGDE